MTETVEQFAARAARWLAENMPRIDPADPPYTVRAEQASWDRAKELQRTLHAGGFAGICFPREYGGLGLDFAYQRAFDAACRGYEMPLILNVPTFAICAATLLDMGTEEQNATASARRSAARRSSASCCPSPAAARIWPG